MLKLSAIIISFNTKPILDDCIQNLLSISEKIKSRVDMEIIVVDNASTDGSCELVKRAYPNVKLIQNKENSGLSVASNQGAAFSDGDYLLYLGTDAYPTHEAVVGMIEYMESDPTVAIATTPLKLRDGKLDMDAHRGFPTPWAAITHFTRLNRLFPKSRLFNQYFMGYTNMSEPHEIDLCISHFMLFRKKVLDELGGWDEDFFVYGEDVDICYRTKQAGYKVVYLPQWETLHYKGVGVGRKGALDVKTASNRSSKTRKRMRMESVRAMRLFYEKHYKDTYPRWLTSIVLLGISLMGKLRTLK